FRLFCYGAAAHRALPSFPTRRSSDLLARDRPWSGRSHEFAVATRGGPRRHVDRDDGPQAATGGRFGISGSQWLRNSRRSWLSRRSEEHTSELQSRENLVCRLLLEKKK